MSAKLRKLIRDIGAEDTLVLNDMELYALNEIMIFVPATYMKGLLKYMMKGSFERITVGGLASQVANTLHADNDSLAMVEVMTLKSLAEEGLGKAKLKKVPRRKVIRNGKK